MIRTKKDLKEYVKHDAASSHRSTKRKFFGDEIWKYQLNLRKYEYYINKCENSRLLTRWFYKICKAKHRFIHHYKGIKLGIEISPNSFEYGLWIVHHGGIVVNRKAKIGHNCIIHQNVTIGNDGKVDDAPRIGNNCLIGAGSIIIGNIELGDNIVIGAGVVCCKSFPDNSIICGFAGKDIRTKKEACL